MLPNKGVEKVFSQARLPNNTWILLNDVTVQLFVLLSRRRPYTTVLGTIVLRGAQKLSWTIKEGVYCDRVWEAQIYSNSFFECKDLAIWFNTITKDKSFQCHGSTWEWRNSLKSMEMVTNWIWKPCRHSRCKIYLQFVNEILYNKSQGMQ